MRISDWSLDVCSSDLHFLPFIALLKDRLDVLSLDGPTDYRLQRLGGFQTWHVPNGDAATEALSRAFFRLTDFPVEDREHVPSETVAIKGGRELDRKSTRLNSSH